LRVITTQNIMTLILTNHRSVVADFGIIKLIDIIKK